jgi:hypothetical protein
VRDFAYRWALGLSQSEADDAIVKNSLKKWQRDIPRQKRPPIQTRILTFIGI